VLLKRIDELQSNPRSPGWDGARRMDRK